MIRFQINGTTTIAQNQVEATPTGGTAHVISTLYDLSINDYVEVLVYQTSGGALNVINGDNRTPEFMMVKVLE